MADPKPIPDWKLERFAVGELSGPAAREVQRALDESPAERARLTALREDSGATLLSHPAPRVVREVERRLRAAGGTGPAQRPHWLAVPAAAMVAAAVLFVLRAQDPSSGSGTIARTVLSDGDRIKGSSELHVFRIRGQSQERLLDGASADAGDNLQLHYLAGGQRFGVIVSIDGAGGATLHLPEDPGSSSELTADSGAAAHGYRLDAAPRFERFFFVTSSSPLATGEVFAAARALARGPDPMGAALTLPDGAQQTSFILRKVPR